MIDVIFTTGANSVTMETGSLKKRLSGKVDLTVFDSDTISIAGSTYNMSKHKITIDDTPVVGDAYDAYTALDALFPNEGSGSNAYVADYTGDYGDYSGIPAITGAGSYLGELTGTELTTTPAVAGDVFISALIFQLVPTSGGVIDDTQWGKLNAGRWTETLEATFFNYSVTVHNNRHYVVIDSTKLKGTAPDVNTVAYLLLPLSSTTGYIPVLT